MKDETQRGLPNAYQSLAQSAFIEYQVVKITGIEKNYLLSIEWFRGNRKVGLSVIGLLQAV